MKQELYVKTKITLDDTLINTHNQVYQEINSLTAKLKELKAIKDKELAPDHLAIHKRTVDLLDNILEGLKVKSAYIMYIKDIMDRSSFEDFKKYKGGK